VSVYEFPKLKLIYLVKTELEVETSAMPRKENKEEIGVCNHKFESKLN